MDRWTRYTSHDGDTEVRHARFRFLRRLTLRGPDGMFLDRWGIDTKTFGIFVHHLTAPDPGQDLHDHPWGFASLVLWGGYVEEIADARDAPHLASVAESFDLPGVLRGEQREWRRGSIHRIRLTEAHRITWVQPHTWTLVIRGRKTRDWGFYPPSGYVSQREYDYSGRGR